MPQKQNEHHGCMWNSDNQALTCFDHICSTEAPWAPWMHMEFWKSSTHSLWWQTWHRYRMSTMDACGILKIKHSLPVITNMEHKHNDHPACMWNADNQALTCFDHEHGTEAEWAPWMHVEFWQSSTHILWSQTCHRSRMSTIDACGILTIKHSHPLITNIAQKQNEHHGCMWNSDNQALTCCDHKHNTDAEWALWMHVEF